jgi:putative flippase GtrA
MIAGILLGIVAGLLANELCDFAPWCVRKLVRWSAFRRYTDPGRAKMRAEELAALINDRPGNLFKLITAVCFAVAAVIVCCRRAVSSRRAVARMPRYRFAGFASAAVAAFMTREVMLTVCVGVLQLTATWASLISWVSGAVVSYVFSRWAWERKGCPNLLKETLPFWAVSGMVVVILTLATRFGYNSSGWMHLRANISGCGRISSGKPGRRPDWASR